MMNVYLLKQVRDRIARRTTTGTGFNMGSWFRRAGVAMGFRQDTTAVAEITTEYDTCGSTACIAGHTVGLAGRRRGASHVVQEARELLGISEADATYLFQGFWSNRAGHHLKHITKKETVAYLDKCIRAGRIVRV